MYGHAVVDSKNDLWLQYWFWYFYNDYNLIGSFLKAGLHEGDWEMIQIRLRDETPDLAIYAQHATAETVAGAGARSISYRGRPQRPRASVPGARVARLVLRVGRRWTGHWFDYADDKSHRSRTSRSTSSSRTTRIGGGSGGQAAGATRRRATTRSTPAVRTGRPATISGITRW